MGRPMTASAVRQTRALRPWFKRAESLALIVAS